MEHHKSYRISTLVISFDQNKIEVSSCGFTLTGLRTEMCNGLRTGQNIKYLLSRYLSGHNVFLFHDIFQKNCQSIATSTALKTFKGTSRTFIESMIFLEENHWSRHCHPPN